MFILRADSQQNNNYSSQIILSHKYMMSNLPFAINPVTLSKLSSADSTWLCTYIEALERQNKTKSQEQIIMDRYIENLRAEVDEMMTADLERKNKENYLNNQIRRLSNDNQILLGELKSRNEKIAMLSQQLDNLKKINQEGHELRVKIQNQYQEHLNKIIQQSNEIIKGVEINRTEQLNKILSLNNELNQKCRKLEQSYAEAVQKSSKLQYKNDSLYKQNVAIHQKLSEANRKLQQKTNGEKMRSVEIHNMNDYLKQIERTNKQLMQENSRIHQCLQKDQKSRELFERQTFQKLMAYEFEVEDWKIRYDQLEQLLEFVKQNIKDMQITIQEQNKNIHALSKSNTNLRNEILRNVMNLADQTEKQRQLNEIKMELASCKGKLAEKQRRLSTCSSRVITPFDQYSLKIKLKHDQTDEEPGSMVSSAYTERIKNYNHKGNARKTNFHGSQNLIING